MFAALTPADEGYDDNVSGGDSTKDNDQFLEHEDSLCPHPHDGGQSEVVDEHRDCHTASLLLSLSHTGHKHKEHKEHGKAELGVELGSISLPKSPTL